MGLPSTASLGRARSRLRDRGDEPVSAASLGAFRILYGVLAFAGATRALAMGWVDQFYVQPELHLKYFGFAWIDAAPAPWMHAVFVAMAALGVLIALGIHTRIVAALHLLLFTYVELIDVSTYLNHYVLFSLLGLWLVLLPSGRALSLDAWRKGGAASIPRWMLWVMRAQIGVVYVHAALAKVSVDWLLHGQPLGIWLSARTDLPVVGALFMEPWLPFVALAAGWAGFLNDLLAPALLSHRRTRPFMFAVLVFFHVMTSYLFDIGLFPLIMLSGATLYFAPDWPRRVLARFRRAPRRPEVATPIPRLGRASAVALVAFLALQALWPLRANLYEGNVLWHEQGMRFAWRVLCREKAGSVSYRVRWDGHPREMHVSPGEYLDLRQESEMSGQPDLILQLAHHIAEEHRRAGHEGVEVRVDALVSLNGRPMARLIDPEVDLTTLRDGFAPADWILSEPPGEPLPLWRPARLAVR